MGLFWLHTYLPAVLHSNNDNRHTVSICAYSLQMKDAVS